ncbi:PTS mannose transporter subunit IIABC [Staphylococcus schleiferi]|uniref:fructose-specific PTS transporter subunit EIIC n=1 Tax=Staphylococcus coagulans TaxID=74706 RepID=UPI00067A25CD|nr:PTS mannose transporter subunit IIABC [Staphylococcus schleiferi]MBA8764770.1 PTS transporter subunit EIIA [Staphylococcus coagulans]AKS70599.1 PTS mannose transporter subunit IIABC [Staphylococcus schleiferi]AKS74633.1 PTS mannose transporter subunit IIABC [Staphylococcus schleiferi]MBT2810226.1 PTS transporter subunit EIIA [Staphylococcus coagulans]
MNILAITSCPNGIAHTYMAQEKLEQAAKKLGVNIKVETQGGIGVENELTVEEIEKADGIIIASDRQVDLSRFVGKPLIRESVRAGIHQPEALIQRVIDGHVPIYQGDKMNTSSEGVAEKNTSTKHQGVQAVYQHLMNGVSFMVPFIVVGGLLIAIALSLGGEKTATQGLVIPDDSFWKPFEKIGSLSFSFMVPILAGYIAMSIADKPGLVPGMIGGAIAADGSFYGSDAGAGFLGGIVAGFLAGYIAKWIKNIKVPKAMAPIMPIIVIPIIASILVGVIFIFVIGAPIASVFSALTVWLKGMQGANIVILAMIIGAMIAFDMGGPVNKVAFLFGSALIAEGNYSVMGMVAVAVCTPPIGLGLATFIEKSKFNQNEIEMGKASFTMGLFGITEGAIPFAAQDPLRVIPANMVGAMIASVIAALGDVGDRVAHGGPIVAVLGGIDHILMFAIAVIVGSFVTMAVVLILRKKPVARRSSNEQVDQMPNERTKEMRDDTHVAVSSVEAKDENAQVDELFDANVILNINQSMSRDHAIDILVDALQKAGYVNDEVVLKEAILAREAEATTALGMNIAMPHAKTDAIRQPVVAVLKNDIGVEWESIDGTWPQLIFLIAVPLHSHDTHLKVLQQLSKALMQDDKRMQLLNASDTKALYSDIQRLI